MQDPRKNLITQFPNLYPRVLYYNSKLTRAMIEGFFNKYGYKVLKITKDTKEYSADKLFMPSVTVYFSKNGTEKYQMCLNSVYVYYIDINFTRDNEFSRDKEICQKMINYFSAFFDENYLQLVEAVENCKEDDLIFD